MKKDQILGLLRHVLTIAGGAIAAQGGDETLISETSGSILVLIGVVWSWWEKTRR